MRLGIAIGLALALLAACATEHAAQAPHVVPSGQKDAGASLIDRRHMIEPMLVACPSYRPAWTAFLEDWKEEPGELPLYIALGDLARHLVELRIAGRTAEFPAVFEVVERWHLQGDACVREAATVGLLEGLQFAASHTVLDESEFEPWLLPESKRWWVKLKRFWAGDSRALRDD